MYLAQCYVISMGDTVYSTFHLQWRGQAHGAVLLLRSRRKTPALPLHFCVYKSIILYILKSFCVHIPPNVTKHIKVLLPEVIFPLSEKLMHRNYQISQHGQILSYIFQNTLICQPEQAKVMWENRTLAYVYCLTRTDIRVHDPPLSPAPSSSLLPVQHQAEG